jgi:hypothetical protein
MEIMSTLKDTWWQFAAATIAIVLFWLPPFLLFGLFSLAVMVSAFIDAAERPVPVPVKLHDRPV